MWIQTLPEKVQLDPEGSILPVHSPLIPSGNQTWLAGKTQIGGSMISPATNIHCWEMLGDFPVQNG